MEQRVHNSLQDWPATTLSMMDRLIIVRSVLNSIPIYLLVNTMLPSLASKIGSSSSETSYEAQDMTVMGYTWYLRIWPANR